MTTARMGLAVVAGPWQEPHVGRGSAEPRGRVQGYIVALPKRGRPHAVGAAPRPDSEGDRSTVTSLSREVINQSSWLPRTSASRPKSAISRLSLEVVVVPGTDIRHSHGTLFAFGATGLILASLIKLRRPASPLSQINRCRPVANAVTAPLHYVRVGCGRDPLGNRG